MSSRSPSMFRSTSRDSFLSHFEDNSAVSMYARSNKRHDLNDACTHTKFNWTLNGIIIPFAFILESAMDDFSWDSVSTTTVDEVLSLIISSGSYINIEIEKRGRVQCSNIHN